MNTFVVIISAFITAAIIYFIVPTQVTKKTIKGLEARFPKAYKQGQIDCINGKIEYQLTKQPDGEMIWSKKGNLNK